MSTSKILKSYPLKGCLNEKINIPSSKPETQRAILIAALACGKSQVYNALHCVETTTMKNACKSIGAGLKELNGCLNIEGSHLLEKTNQDIITINCLESGLVARTFLAISSVINSPVYITGGKILKRRALKPLTSALEKIGVDILFLETPGQLPLINRSTYLPGGTFNLPGNISSQFITSLLLAAPLAEEKIQIRVKTPVYSKSYIQQTIFSMKQAGVTVEYSDDFSFFEVEPNSYNPINIKLSGDYTSASYFLAKAALFPGTTILKNMSQFSLQGERKILDLLENLGIKISFNPLKNELIAQNSISELSGDIEFDVADCPNIIPTLAAIGAFVRGNFRITGGLVTNYHKSSRIDAMITELRKLGVQIHPIYKNDLLDGFEIHGKPCYTGGTSFSSWGDHRIFMSLLLVSAKCSESNYIDGYDSIDCSFPDFLNEFQKQGLDYEIIDRLKPLKNMHPSFTYSKKEVS